MPVTKLIELNSGHTMPVVGLGTGKIIESQEIHNTIGIAVKNGYRHFDTAFSYKNEIGIGEALKYQIDAGNVTRHEIFIATKLPLIGMSRSRVSQFVNLSLKNLQLDYIDLYLIHWPVGLTYVSEHELMPRDENGQLQLDMTTNLVEIWKAMEDQVDQGRVKAIGLSNCTQQQIQRILNICRIKPASLQIEVHLYFQQNELRMFCKKNDISVTAYSPLGSQGRSNYINAHKLKVPKLFQDPVVKKIAASHEKTPAQILLRFLVQGLNVQVIPKTVDSTRLHENIEIFDFELSTEEIERLMELDEGEFGRCCRSFEGAILHPECPFD
ncbi:aldose reductase-related protein 2-like [Folsomia candida]|uniref:aldose reductase-related protein 2-like n=1 Tax=Folsomia candida TaxID=158441 RepID=UPI000B8FF6CD|nr:aldose reductase-related protein 2-like [Folsomia candida]